MRILVYGAGAVGGYFGARLALGGHAVTLVARGANLAALRTRGLSVRLATETLRLPTVRVVEDPAAADPPELILVCVKSHATAEVAAALRGVVHPDTILLSLQNGIENEETLAQGLGVPPLMLALTRIGVELVAPGEVLYSGRGTIYFGEADGRESPRARRALEAFERAGVPAELRPDITALAWEKLAWNAAFNAVSALTDATVAEMLAQPGTRALIVETMAEVDAVAAALGVAVRRTRLPAVLDDSVGGLPAFPTSMLQDRRRGTRLEWNAISGAVVRAADRVGIPVPLNRTLLALLERLDASARAAT